MKRKTYLISGGIAILLLTFLLGRLTSPSDSPQDHSEHDHGASAASAEATTWTCSMHPQIQQPEPGDCPICGMDLIPLVSDSGEDLGPRELSMSESSRALADIETALVQRRFPEAEVRLVGKLEYDETKVKSLTARFPARIEELFVNYTGVPVKKGDHLAQVYSPELLTAQSELLSAYRFDPDSAATQAAREKLRLWDLLPEQIDSIIASGKASDTFELKAPLSGIVVRKNANEGDYLQTGQSLFTIVDLSELWLMLEAFESDLPWLKFGQSVTFSVEAFPGQSFEGRIAFIEPELDRSTRTITVRVNVPNTDGMLKPGMFAKAIAKSKVAAGGKVYTSEFAGKWISPMHPEIVKDGPGECDICGMDLVPAEELGYVQDEDQEAPLVVPATAVLRTGKRSIVYVEKPEAKRPTYQGREISLGPRAGDFFLVESGLQEGEQVVVHGAFKIDSALQIQAKPSMMNPQGGGAPPSHDHGSGSMESSDQGEHAGHERLPQPAAIALDPELAAELLPSYFELQAALAGDDLEAAKASLQQMMSISGHSGPLPDLIHRMLAADTLDELRRPHFDTLSSAFIEVVSQNPDSFDEDLFRMHCPMVYPDGGADWLQDNAELKNPYFGSAMLTCGELRAEY